MILVLAGSSSTGALSLGSEFLCNCLPRCLSAVKPESIYDRRCGMYPKLGCCMYTLYVPKVLTGPLVSSAVVSHVPVNMLRQLHSSSH